MAGVDLDAGVEQYLKIETDLCERLESLFSDSNLKYDFPGSVFATYNSLKDQNAKVPHENFVKLFGGGSKKKVLFVGLNPITKGMGQIPFGSEFETKWMRDNRGVDVGWNACPIVVDIRYPRERLSEEDIRMYQDQVNHQDEDTSASKSFWGLIQVICETPQQFAKNCFVQNYCPLFLMDKECKSISHVVDPAQDYDPIKYDREPLKKACDEALYQSIKLMKPEYIVALGKPLEKLLSHETFKTRLNELPTTPTIHLLRDPSPQHGNSKEEVEQNIHFWIKNQKRQLELNMRDIFQHMEFPHNFAEGRMPRGRDGVNFPSMGL